MSPLHSPGDPGSPSGSTSRSLLANARHADPHAWARLVNLYAPLVAGWCHRWGVPPQDVVDLLQDVFAAVSRNLARFHRDRPGDTFRGWLRTIAQNKVHDYFRRRAGEPAAMGGTEALIRMALVEDPNSNSDSVEAGDREAVSGLLLRALQSIRPEFHDRTWRAFWDIVIEGRSTDEVAAALNMQAGTVRVAKSRVLMRLRRELGELSEDS